MACQCVISNVTTGCCCMLISVFTLSQCSQPFEQSTKAKSVCPATSMAKVLLSFIYQRALQSIIKCCLNAMSIGRAETCLVVTVGTDTHSPATTESAAEHDAMLCLRATAHHPASQRVFSVTLINLAVLTVCPATLSSRRAASLLHVCV